MNSNQIYEHAERIANAVSKLASGAAHRQVMEPLARDISALEREAHGELVEEIARMLSSAFVEDDDESTCRCGRDVSHVEPHTCPYEVEIHGDKVHRCQCCDLCEGKCSDNI